VGCVELKYRCIGFVRVNPEVDPPPAVEEGLWVPREDILRIDPDAELPEALVERCCDYRFLVAGSLHFSDPNTQRCARGHPCLARLSRRFLHTLDAAEPLSLCGMRERTQALRPPESCPLYHVAGQSRRATHAGDRGLVSTSIASTTSSEPWRRRQPTVVIWSPAGNRVPSRGPSPASA